MNIEELHKKILYPIVRVRTEKAGGSGSVIFSKVNPKNPEEYQSFVMTCEHVIDDAITVKEKEWDSTAKKKIDKEYLQQVTVELFDYVYLSKVNSANAIKADIVAYDKEHDIAILKLDSPKKVEYTANIIPKDKIKDIKLFSETETSGCSLLHDPFSNQGRITSLSEMIENKLYYMGNGNSIFGNSGGAVFLAETGEQIGITARITAMQLGFGMDIITWMGFFVAPQRLYEFFDAQELKFLYDPSDTYEAAMKRRERKQKEAMLQRKSEDDDKNGYKKNEFNDRST